MDFILSRCPRETRKSRSKNPMKSVKGNSIVCEHRCKIKARKRKRAVEIPIPNFGAEDLGLKGLGAKSLKEELPKVQSRILPTPSFPWSTNLSESEGEETEICFRSVSAKKSSHVKENYNDDNFRAGPTGASSHSPSMIDLDVKCSVSNSADCAGSSPNQQGLMCRNNEIQTFSSPKDMGKRLVVNNYPIKEKSIDEVHELQLHVDSIFLQIDIKSATVKTFQKALQKKLGRVLVSREKMLVKARLSDLVNQRALPNASSSELYEKTSMPSLTRNSSSTKPTKSAVDTNLSTSDETALSSVVQQSSPGKSNNSTLLETERDSSEERQQKGDASDMKMISTKPRPRIGKNLCYNVGEIATDENHVTPRRGSNENQRNVTLNDQEFSSNPQSPDKQLLEETVLSVPNGEMIPSYNEARKLIPYKDPDGISQALPKKAKKNIPKSSSDTVEHDFVKTAININKNSKGGALGVSTRTLRTEQPFQHAQPKAKPLKSRRKIRKGSCALCTTCQCKNAQSISTGGKFADFARSDSASEKALIRRAQKLEKSSENIENQIEIVQRKLKQLRRDIWKTKEHEKGSARSKKEDLKQRFLCDAKVFDSEQMQSNALGEIVSRNARNALFPDTPCFQPTLTQILGETSKQRSKKTENFLAIEELETIDKEVDDLRKSDSDVDETDLNDKQLSLYTKEEIPNSKPKRMEWRLVRSAEVPESDAEWSFWRALRVDARNVNEREHFLPTLFSQPDGILDDQPHSSLSWDRMFTTDTIHPTENPGIRQLASLFEDSEIPLMLEESNPNRNCIASPGTPDIPVELSQLTPTGKEFAIKLISEIGEDGNVLSLLEQSCPNWEENVAYAMKRDSKQEISAALQQVRKHQGRMIENKKIVLQSWQHQFCALEFFEKCLLSSLKRFEV